MANTNPNGVVATIKTADLVKIWGETITIKRSQRDNAKFPLYMAPSTGPVHLNTAKGQDGLLEFGIFKGAESVEEKPEPSPALPEQIPEDEKPEETVPPEHPRQAAGDDGSLLGWLDKQIF